MDTPSIQGLLGNNWEALQEQDKWICTKEDSNHDKQEVCTDKGNKQDKQEEPTEEGGSRAMDK